MQIDQLLDGHHSRPYAQHKDFSQEASPSLGLLTKTIARSPGCRFILRARIRSKYKDDLIFVGEDFIQLREISGNDPYPALIATKADFDCRIMSAKVLGDAVSVDDDFNDDIKLEDREMNDLADTPKIPPQFLVMTLMTGQLVFVSACDSTDGAVEFKMTYIPLVVTNNPLLQLGRHLAVDPKSRAIAVGAAQEDLYLFTVEKWDTNKPWEPVLPISRERPFAKVKKGVIQQMDFLHPPDDDPDHVILLLVVVKHSKVSFVRIEWQHSEGISRAQYHNPYSIGQAAPLPNLLIPVQNSKGGAFIMTRGPFVLVYTDILTGSPQGPHRVELPAPSDPESERPGISPLLPRWVAWARPERDAGADKDCIYLAREDGNVFSISLSKQKPGEEANAHHVNDAGCHIESAFAIFGNPRQSDFSIIWGDSSDGGIYRISAYSADDPAPGSDLISIMPNWMPNFDLIASKLPRNMDGTARSRDALFSPGGKQPYGKISELRMGIKAGSVGRFPTFPGIVQLWTLPINESGKLIVLLSSPSDSKALLIPPDAFDDPQGGEIVEVASDVGLNFKCRTINAAKLAIADDCILQITEDDISISRNGQHGLLCESCASDWKITAAAIGEEHDVALTVVRSNGHSLIRLLQVEVGDDEASLHVVGDPVASDKHFVSAAIFSCPAGLFAVLGTSESSLSFYQLSPTEGLMMQLEYKLSGQSDVSNACEDVVVLSDARQTRSGSSWTFMLLCGLRDGTLETLRLRVQQEEGLSVEPNRRFSLGLTTVKLRPDGATLSDRNYIPLSVAAYASCGNDFYKIEWHGAGSKEFSISDVWVTDAKEPSFQQAAVTAFGVVPPCDYLDPTLAPSLILISSREGHITRAEKRPVVVPRSMPVSGSPKRAIYSHNYGCFITTGAETSVHPSLSSRSSQSRSLRPVVQFKADGPKRWEYIHHLEPGRQVNSIVEWNYKESRSKPHALILLGCGPIDKTVSPKGEIVLLYLSRSDGIIEAVQAKTVKTLDTAVYALAPYGDRGLIACTDPWTYMFEYQTAEARFAEVCKFRTASFGTYVTTAPPLITITTNVDSLVTLQYLPEGNILKPIGLDSGHRATVFHLPLVFPGPANPTSSLHSVVNGHSAKSVAMNLVSTRDKCLVGQLAPSHTIRTFTNTVPTLFKAKLPRSLIRLRQANIRPPWKDATVPGILEDRIVGLSVDGALMGLAILDPGLTHRLRWVQRLCERSNVICPMAPNNTMKRREDVLDMEDDRNLVLPPPGFEANAEAVGQMMIDPADMHINGDILQRLMHKGGAACLIQLLETELGRKDRLADWVRENYDDQLAMVETLAEEAKMALDRWW